MSLAPEHERFAKNTTIMAQAVHEGVKRLYDAGYKTIDPDLIDSAVRVISIFNKHFLIQGFIENSHEKCWDKFKEREEDFFVENAGDIFKYLPMDKVNLFKDLFVTKDSAGNSVVSQNLKNQLWDLFDAMIKISIKYVHNNRSPYSYSTPNGISNAYGASFFDEVDIGHHANVWNVRLEFPPNF
ncbi:Hypothetical protein HVR_LOCUS1308 [uncultured virus]|nr:Hypothetical protein HVR_LOCUS1308 [uncultured virus]